MVLHGSSNRADRRHAVTDNRGRIADEREWLAHDCDAVGTTRVAHVNSVSAAADLRDDCADIRDFAADQRDIAATYEAFVHGVNDEEAFEARERAHGDRLRAKADRVSSELDRYLLADFESVTQNLPPSHYRFEVDDAQSGTAEDWDR